MTETVETIADVENRLLALRWAASRRAVASKMAALCGIHAGTWRRWRAGDHEPNLATWRRIITQLDKIEGGKNAVDRRRNGGAKKVR